jgi:hypothetical protein
MNKLLITSSPDSSIPLSLTRLDPEVWSVEWSSLDDDFDLDLDCDAVLAVAELSCWSFERVKRFLGMCSGRDCQVLLVATGCSDLAVDSDGQADFPDSDVYRAYDGLLESATRALYETDPLMRKRVSICPVGTGHSCGDHFLERSLGLLLRAPPDSPRSVTASDSGSLIEITA